MEGMGWGYKWVFEGGVIHKTCIGVVLKGRGEGC